MDKDIIYTDLYEYLKYKGAIGIFQASNGLPGLIVKSNPNFRKTIKFVDTEKLKSDKNGVWFELVHKHE